MFINQKVKGSRNLIIMICRWQITYERNEKNERNETMDRGGNDLQFTQDVALGI